MNQSAAPFTVEESDDTILLYPIQDIWVEPSKLPPRQWIYDKHYIRKYVSSTVAPGGGGKSSLALAEAVAMASGRPLLGKPITRKYRVWYWNGEDPRDEIMRRVAAICIKYSVLPEELNDHLFIASGREDKSRITIAHETERGGFKVDTPSIPKLKAAIRAWKLDVMILDPLVRTHGVSENDNQRMNAVIEKYAEIADELDCAIELVHHVRKPNGSGEYDVLDGRGAVALHAAARSMRVLNVLAKDEAPGVGVHPEQHRFYFRVDNGKANMAAPTKDASWYRIDSVSLDNHVGDGTKPDDLPHDKVGVVTKYIPPEPQNVPMEVIRGIQETLQVHDFRDSPQSPDWAGYMIADKLHYKLAYVDTKKRKQESDDSKLVRRKVLDLIQKWKQRQFLEAVPKYDPVTRKARKLLKVKNFASGADDNDVTF